MTPVTVIRRALTRLWRRREPPRDVFSPPRPNERARPIPVARDHDQPDFDPRPDDVLAGRS